MKRNLLSLTLALSLSILILTLFGLALASTDEASYASERTASANTPDLVINLYAGDETILANAMISYTIAYTNRLGSSLSNVVITSTLSPKQTYSITHGYLSSPLIPTPSFTYTGGFYEGYTLRWQLGTVEADAQGWIVVTTTVPLEAEPPWDSSDRWPLLGMSAIITTSTPGVSTGNLQGQPGDDASVMVVGPVLQITKSAFPDPVRPGRLLTYTLVVENQDREDVIPATDLKITDTLPAYTEFIWASDMGVYSPTSGLITWHPSDPLERGNTLEVSFTVRLTHSFPVCPPPQIQNLGYKVAADETFRLVVGKNLKTNVDDVLEKTIDTPTPPPADNEVFPGGIVTYTVSIHNPLHDQTLTGLSVTDTLPGTPNPFSFTHVLTRSPAPITTTPQIVWDGLSIEPGGMITFAFSAWVPYHIDIGTGSKKYQNSLSGSAEGVWICDMEDTKPSEAKVTRQIILNKSVYPDHVLSGELVTYTITLENIGKNDIAGIRLTDTLPADFYYIDMVYGPRPEVGYRHNPVVWDDLTVPAYSERALVFVAKAIGAPLETYANCLSATSPWTTIPSVCEAKVKIDSPFTLNKTVTPSEIVVDEERAYYTIQICNVATGTYTIDGIGDQLYEGFYIVDAPTHPGRPYHLEDYPMSPPVDLGPGDCWEYPFGADVTLDVGCGDLPKTYWNSPPNLGFHLQEDPVDWWYVNTKKLAPLRVVPHVMMVKEASRCAVLPGETVIYTITLSNSIANSINQVRIVDTLPGDGETYFEFLDMVAGDSPVNTTTNVIEWQDQVIPALGNLELVFRVRVPGDITLGKYKNAVFAESLMGAPICIEVIDPTAPVDVMREIVELKKEASPPEVPPLGTVRYEIKLKNMDCEPITGVVVTDTLPRILDEDFTFVEMASGPEPEQVDGRQIVWRDLTIPSKTTLELAFDVRASTLYGLGINHVDAWCPRSQEITPEDPWDVKAPVNVLPGVLVEKTVFPTHTVAGSSVVYTITVHNPSDNELTDVYITDTLPACFSYLNMVYSDPPVAPIQRSPPVWVIDVGKGKTQQIAFRAGVRSCDVVSDTYYNSVDGYSPDALIPGITDRAPVEVEATGAPCVSLSKTVFPTQTTNGGIVAYTITMQNNSFEDFDEVRMTDTLPSKFSFLEDMSVGPTLVATSPQVVWEMSRLRWGQSQDFVFKARVGYGASSGTYSNTVAGESTTIEVPTLEETAPVDVIASTPLGAFLRKTTSPNPAVNGGTVIYTVTLKNQLDTVLNSVRITDTLPPGFSYLQMMDGSDPTGDSSTLVWTLDQLEVGGRRTWVYQAYVGCSLITGTYSSTLEGHSLSAMISGQEEAGPVQVSASGMPCVELYKTASPTQTVRGGVVTYTIVITNQSGLALENVHLTDTLPTDFTYLKMLNYGPIPVITSPHVVWDLLQMNDGEGHELSFQARVASNAALGTHYNGLDGSSTPAYVPKIEEAAPVEVKTTLSDSSIVFLPLVLRNYQ